MHTETITTLLSAPASAVFNYMSDPVNLSEWATEFCLGLSEEGGIYKAMTPMGELVISIDADKESGVIDMYASADGSKCIPLATRALPISDTQTVYTATFIQQPSLPDELFQQQLGSFRKEMDNLKTLFTQ